MVFSARHIVYKMQKFFAIIVLACLAAQVMATNYNLSTGVYPPCSTSWSVSGNTYSCYGDGKVTLGDGDILTANTNITISASNGFTFSNTTIGSVSANINLVSDYGNVIGTGSNTIFGSVTSNSGTVNLANTEVSGSLTTTNGGSSITLTGGSVGGNISAGSSVSLTNVNVTGSSIYAPAGVNFSNSQIGSAGSPVTISTSYAGISVQGSTVYGDLTAPNYATISVNASSDVYGSCTPEGTPNACNPAPKTCTTGFVGGITGSYYNNKNLSGSPKGTRTDTSINFDWGTGSPGVSGIGGDTFSVRWTGQLRAPATGNYRFQTNSDDGVRVWVYNQLIIDQWNDHAVQTDTSGQIYLEAGQAYPIKVEYYENHGYAVMQLLWSRPDKASYSVIDTEVASNPDTSSYCDLSQTCDNGFIGGIPGDYFSNNSLNGSPAVSRLDSAIDFVWDSGSPGVAGIGSDNFSVRWNGSIKVKASGSYQFETISDDGVRLWIDGTKIIDNWGDHSATTNDSSAIYLSTGNHTIKLEYYERQGVSVIELHWKKPGDSSFRTVQSCPSSLAYYGIDHSGYGITCAAEAVTITAYDDTGSPITPSAGTQITLSTSPATGVWSGGNIYTFDGSSTSIVAYLQQSTPATLNINVSDGVNSEDSGLDPSITFSDAGLKFYGNSALAAMPNQVAGKTDASPILHAVKTNSDTGACEAQINGTRSVNLAYVCRNPSSCIAGQILSLNGGSVKANANGASLNYSAVSLNFDASGSASIPFNYSDVGQVKLYAQVTLPATTQDPQVTLTGSSNDFVVKPDKLVITGVKNSRDVANPGKTGESGSANDFETAGKAFKVSVQAQNALGQPTPNFGNESPSENNISLSAVALKYPAAGSLTPLSGSLIAFSQTTPAGTFVNSNVIWDQVGSLTIKPTLQDGDYMGAGDLADPVPDTSLPVIGRFYPDHFTLISARSADSCSGFTYMGQPVIGLMYQLEARSDKDNRVSNYGGGYGGAATVSYVVENNDGGDGASLSPRFSDGVAKSWNQGRLTVNANQAVFNRQTGSYAPDGPYTQLQLGLQLTDTFDNRQLAGLNMNATTSGACSGTSCTAISLGNTLNLLWGRLRLDDAFGPESVNLPVNFSTEYWTGGFFTKNTDDSCTQILRSAISYPAGNILTPANLNVALSGGATTGNYANLGPTLVNFRKGDAGHYFSAPGSGTGPFIVGVDLTAYPWLRFDWNQDGNYDNDNDKATDLLTAHYSFGQYRGNDRVIYWREKLQ